MTTESISIENGVLAPDDGLIKIWWWKAGAELNQELKANKPVWEIFNSQQVFGLCAAGKVIEVEEKILIDNFTAI